ncbi:MAG: CDP-alcohol phosphatidyltransferase family protein [Candidatus Planktophila sp.]|jgi:archaetidylinositol phosphate synthase|tara:strand:- start:3676 stop:4308 length:633 start_codon:yes stop_codon:yes gene_type:complete
MNQSEFTNRWSALHGGAEIKGIVKAWLAISFRSAKLATTLRVTPNFLTIIGVVFAIAMALNPTSIWCIPLLVISLFADGIDGSVAIVQAKVSAWGAVLDAVADRISEALWFYVTYQLGAPAWIALGAFVIATTQEYARARIAGLGVSDVGVVTPAERPVRASFIFVALIASAIGLEISAVVIGALLLLQIISFYLVLRWAYHRLRDNFSA